MGFGRNTPKLNVHNNVASLRDLEILGTSQPMFLLHTGQLPIILLRGQVQILSSLSLSAKSDHLILLVDIFITEIGIYWKKNKEQEKHDKWLQYIGDQEMANIFLPLAQMEQFGNSFDQIPSYSAIFGLQITYWI